MSIRVKTETVEIDSVKQLPNNPRRGNVPKIAESLGLLGQYRPIVVRREDNTILAGNHTWLAAKALKRKKIAVTWISCDDETARKIILADNRTSDLASYDNEALRDELRSLPDLEGTGYTQLDIDRLDGLFTDSSSRPTDENEPAAKSDDYWLEVGEFVGQLDRDTYLAWNSALVDVTGNKPASARKEVRTRLKIPMDAKPKVKEIGELISGQGEISIQEGSIEEIGTLIPYPHNVREGDVGAISVVLSEIGQYRPIVVNKLTREILVGNHTWFAASMLKWKEIAVVFVDVDEVIAKKIVLADNRTSDLATYDDEALLSMLLGVGDLRGTGFDRDDLDALADGASGKPMETTDKIRVRVGEYRMRVAPETFNTWKATLEAGNEMAEILERLQLPTSSLLSY